MYITLAGSGPEYSNKLYNTIDIKPFSYVCLNNISFRKNEIIVLGSTGQLYFRYDDDNVYNATVPAGTYDINTLCEALNLSMKLAVPYVGVTFTPQVQLDASVKILIEYFTINPRDELNRADDLYNDVLLDNDKREFSMDYAPYLLDSGYDYVNRSGYAVLKDVGDNITAESYCVQAAYFDNVIYENHFQTLAVAPFLGDAQGAYVTANGTPGTEFANQSSSTNGLSNAIAQLHYQGYGLTTPIYVDNLNTEALEKVNGSANLLMREGMISFVVGSQNSTKDFVICTGAEDSTVAEPPLPVSLADFNTGADNIWLWMHWSDPRSEVAKQSLLKFGKHNHNDGAWVEFSSRSVPAQYECTQTAEGNLFNIDFQPQQIEAVDVEYGRFGPSVIMNTLSYAVEGDTRTVVAYYDMDVAAGETRFYVDNVLDATPQFNTLENTHNNYKYLWNNNADEYDGNACCGHYWGVGLNTAVSGVSKNDGSQIGYPFTLATGAGNISFLQASGAPTNLAPGIHQTAFSCSRNFQSGTTGYRNAFYKLPNMFGATADRANPGEINSGNLEVDGTVIPTIMPGENAFGAPAISICFRLDISDTLYHTIFAYKGFRPAPAATVPHVLLALQTGTTNQVKISNGDPTQVENIDLIRLDDGLSYDLQKEKWINIAVVFQSEAANQSPWLIVGIDEDGTIFSATAATTTGSPKQAIYGIGGSDACDGTQTVVSGMCGLIKFFKIQYMHGVPYSASEAYSIETTAKLLCYDIIEVQGDQEYFTYKDQNRQFSLVEEDGSVVGGFRGYGIAERSTPCTAIAGQAEVNGKIANYNPYDTLFSNIVWRQNFKPSLGNRVVAMDFGGGDQLPRYQEGGQDYVGGGLALLAPTNTVLADIGWNSGSELAGPYTPFPEGGGNNIIATFLADKAADTEQGTNNNRIHIDNLPIQSYNGKVGTMDRAIYQTTATLNNTFSSNDYQYSCIDVPHKIYIALNNGASMHLNEFKVKITDIDDKLDPEILESQLTIEIKDKDELLLCN